MTTGRMTAIGILAAAAVALTAFGAAASAEPAAEATAPYAQSATRVPPGAYAEINDIIARMNQAIDANDYEAYAGFYAEDGHIDSGFGPLSRGREAIVASLNQSAPFITNKRHVASNVVLNGDRNRLTAVYYLTVFERASGLALAGTALITDTFERRDGRWQVVSHVTRMDPATLAAMAAAMAPPAKR